MQACDYDLCQRCVEAAVGGVGTQCLYRDAGDVLATDEDFKFLHDEIATPLMKQPGGLGQAYAYFGAANDLHLRLHGESSSSALYNMCSCLCLSAAASANVNGDQLPPFLSGVSLTTLVEARLDLAASMLELSLDAGFSDVAMLRQSTNIGPLRARRNERFSRALRRLLPDSADCFTATRTIDRMTAPAPPLRSPSNLLSARISLAHSAPSSPVHLVREPLRTLNSGGLACISAYGAGDVCTKKPATSPSSRAQRTSYTAQAVTISKTGGSCFGPPRLLSGVV